MRSFSAFLGLVLPVFFCTPSVFAGGPEPSGTHYVEEALKPFVDSGELPGATCVLEKDGRRETCCIGYANVEKKIPISMDSLFMQCSQTKGFCGVTMAILVEEGKVSLDDPVSKYLPEFKELWVQVSNTNDTKVLKKAKNVMKVRHVMTHMAGFPFELPAKQGSIPGGGWSGGMPIRSVAAEAAAHPLLFEPGTSGQYSNTGLDVGAAIVEMVTHEKWDAFLKRRVLDPLGMTNTCFKPTDEQLKGHVELYVIWKDKKPQWLYEEQMAKRPYNDAHVFPSAGAGLWTTANDQIKFYHMLMNLGLGDNGARILKEETFRKVLATSQVSGGNYSLGLTLWDDGWIGHGGAYGTNAGVNWKTKELKLWVVQQIGSGPRPWNKLRDAAVDRFFGKGQDKSNLEAYTGRTK